VTEFGICSRQSDRLQLCLVNSNLIITTLMTSNITSKGKFDERLRGFNTWIFKTIYKSQLIWI